MCHNTAFDFNDNVSPRAAVIFIRLVEARLGILLYDEKELPMPQIGEPGGEDDAKTHKAAAGPIQLPAAKKARQGK